MSAALRSDLAQSNSERLLEQSVRLLAEMRTLQRQIAPVGSHETLTDNPHQTTAAQVGAATLADMALVNFRTTALEAGQADVTPRLTALTGALSEVVSYLEAGVPDEDVVSPAPPGGFARSVAAVARSWENVGRYCSASQTPAQNRQALTYAIDQHAVLEFPAGVTLIDDVVHPRAGQQWIGKGEGASWLRLDKSQRPANERVALPVINILPDRPGVTIRGLSVDQGTQGLVQPLLGAQVSYWLTCALVVQASNTDILGCGFYNSFDNGLAVGRLQQVSGDGITTPIFSTIVSFEPRDIVVDNCYAYRCGIGEHDLFLPGMAGPEQGKKGAGINIGNASVVTVSNNMTRECGNGIAVDFGAGANCVLDGNITEFTRQDTAYPYNGSGIGLYIASGPVNCIGHQDRFADRLGIVADALAQGVNITGGQVYASRGAGVRITGTDCTITGLQVAECSQEGAGLHPGISIDAGYGAGDLHIMMTGVRSYGALQSDGIRETGVNGRTVRGKILGDFRGNISSTGITTLGQTVYL